MKKYFIVNGEFAFTIRLLELAVILFTLYIMMNFYVSIILNANKLGIFWIPLSGIYLFLIGGIKHLMTLRASMQQFHAAVGDEFYYKTYPSLLRRTLVLENIRSVKKPSWRNDKTYKVDYAYFRDNPAALKRELKREMRSALNSFTDYARLDSISKKKVLSDE